MATSILLHLSLNDKIILALLVLAYKRAKDNAYTKRYSQLHAEQIAEKKRIYYQKNATRFKAKQNGYWQENAETIKAKQKVYYRLNAEQIEIKAKIYRKANAERIAEKKRIYYQQNITQEKMKRRAYYQTNTEKIKNKVKIYYQSHTEQVKKYVAAWMARYPEKTQAMQQRRRAKIAGAPVNDLTAAQIKAIKAHYHYTCSYCGRRQPRRITIDHIDPVAKGGPNTYTNIILACRRCNSIKHTGPVLCPVQPLLLL